MDIPQVPQQNQQVSNVAPVMPSPTEVSGISPEQGEMSQDEMRSNLEAMMSKIDTKYQDFKTQKDSTETSIQEQNNETLRQFFDILQQAGIDPSNVEEVRGFLDKIKASNPELYQKIESALQSIIGDESVDQNSEEIIGETPVDSSQLNMNINNNETPQENL